MRWLGISWMWIFQIDGIVVELLLITIIILIFQQVDGLVTIWMWIFQIFEMDVDDSSVCWFSEPQHLTWLQDLRECEVRRRNVLERVVHELINRLAHCQEMNCEYFEHLKWCLYNFDSYLSKVNKFTYCSTLIWFISRFTRNLIRMN